MAETHGALTGRITHQPTIEETNQQINNLFASNNVVPDGPGEEAFWHAVEEVEEINPTAATELMVLSDRWLALRARAARTADG